MVPGEDTRLLLASLIVVIVGGMGSVVGAAIGAAILGLAETYGLAYAPTYSVVFTFVILIAGAGVPAARHPGQAGMSAGRTGVSAHELAASQRRRGRCARRGGGERRCGVATACRDRAVPTAARRRWLADLCAHVAPRHVVVLAAAARRSRSSPRRSSPSRSARSRWSLGLIALSLTFLGGYGGMVSLAQMTVAGIAGYAGGDPRHQQRRPRSAWAGRGGWRCRSRCRSRRVARR